MPAFLWLEGAFLGSGDSGVEAGDLARIFLQPLAGSLRTSYIVPMATRGGKNKSPKVKVLSSKVTFRGPAFYVTTQRVKEPGGVTARRDIVRHNGSVVVLALEESGAAPRVLLERQYRHAAGDYLWELPAGHVDLGEKPRAAGPRELQEETGYTAREWKLALSFYVSPGFLTEVMTVYLARGLKRGQAAQEEDEKIATRFFPLPTAVNMVMRGGIRDAKTISGILWLSHALASGLLRRRNKTAIKAIRKLHK